MAYVIRALLLTTPAAAALAAIRPDMTVTNLGQGLNLLPLPPSRLKEFGTNAEVFEVGENGEFDDYTAGVAEILEQIAKEGDAAFVGAEFHGGSGTQWAIVHSANHKPQAIKGADAINQALRQLGVASVPPSDEFETIGLGRFRTTEDWT